MLGVERSSIFASVKRHWGFVLFVLGSLGGYGGWIWLDQRHGTLRGPVTPNTIAFYLFSFVCFIGLIVWAEKRPLPMRAVWVWAILFRAILLFTSPTLSDDVYRYIWDGYVATQGVSPYAFPIDSPQLDYLDIPLRALTNNSWMASPYMPVAQWLFASLAFIFPIAPLFFQLAMVIFDLLTAWLISKILTLGNYPQHRLILYLLNPFVIVEVAHSAHVDAWMIFLLMGALWLSWQPKNNGTYRRIEKESLKYLGSPLLLAFSTLTKIIPVLTLPVLFWRWSWKQRFFYGLVTIGLAIPAGVRVGWGLEGDLDGTGLFGALRIYAEHWMFNSALFAPLLELITQWGISEPLEITKRAAFFLILIVLILVWLAARRVQSIPQFFRLTAVPLVAYLLLTPTVHPWYALSVAPFLPFFSPTSEERSWRGWLFIGGWLYLNATLIFSYLTYRDPLNFGELTWVRQVEWIPTLLILGIYVYLNFFSGKFGTDA